MRATIFLMIAVFVFQCCSEPIDTGNEKAEVIDTNVLIQLDSLWNIMVFEDGGCLTGGQFVRNGQFGGEACVMTDHHRRGKKWGSFFRHSRDELTLFLTTKLSDTTITKIHTCPCSNSTNGEVAVYTLHYLYKTNWFDLEGFESYGNKEGNGCEDNQQVWLQEVLLNEKSHLALKNQWLEMIK